MDNATIGDGTRMRYEFVWPHTSRTTDEIGDLSEAGFDCTIGDIVDVARADDECEVNIIGFDPK